MPSAALMVLLPGTVFAMTGTPLGWDLPVLEGFNFVGGATVPPAFLALLVALTHLSRGAPGRIRTRRHFVGK